MTRLFHVTIRRVLTLAHVVSSAPETVPPHPSVPPLQVMESAHESGSNSTTCNDMQESNHRQVYLVWGRLDVPENLQLSQTLHVCHICLHWGGFGGQCRHIWHTWSVWDMPVPWNVWDKKRLVCGISLRHLCALRCALPLVHRCV